ncbi:Outer membrane protein P4 [Flavobacterium longum]|uniref:5'-nucleotidase, lipoprotein e(P4) family n=1 Tax=Flavobacterium longum TaxID=1299340 RepID=UPI0039ED9A8A
MKTYKIAVIALLLASFSCKAPQQAVRQSTIGNIELNGKLYAAVFQQRAAEYSALCQQAYNIAQMQIDAALKESHAKPLAIVSDIDETLLDNSPYAVTMAQKGQSYEQSSWLEWTSKGNAQPMFGSQKFYNDAAAKGIEVFYITNRSVKDKPGTVANLKKFGFPYADEAHVIVRETVSSKEPRRQKVAETHDIVLLLGDNLSDFSAVFDKKDENGRQQGVTENAALFGKKFIVLPNSGYGDWESAIFDYDHKKTQRQKDSIYLSKLNGY